MGRLSYGDFERILYRFCYPSKGITYPEFSRMLLKAAGDSNMDSMIDSLNTETLSRIRGNKENLPLSVVAIYDRDNVRENIETYFMKEIRPKIAEVQVASVISDFINLIEQDKKERKQLRGTDDWEKRLTRYAVPETLNEFLTDVFLYCVKQKKRLPKKTGVPF